MILAFSLRQPSLWAVVATSVATALVGAWALWDAWQAPKAPRSARVALAVTLGSLVQWSCFVTMRALGVWTLAEYEAVVGPYRLLVFSPIGAWGVIFTAHWFLRRSVRAQSGCLDAICDRSNVGKE